MDDDAWMLGFLAGARLLAGQYDEYAKLRDDYQSRNASDVPLNVPAGVPKKKVKPSMLGRKRSRSK